MFLRTLISALFFSLSAAALSQGMSQELYLTLAGSPTTPGVISTRSTEDVSLRVLSGSEVSFSRASGRDYQLRASGGFYWTQVEQVPMDSESIAILPTLRDDGSVELSLNIARKNGDSLQRYRSTLLAQPGEWVQLFGPPQTQSRGTTTYGTAQASADALYLRVEY